LNEDDPSNLRAGWAAAVVPFRKPEKSESSPPSTRSVAASAPVLAHPGSASAVVAPRVAFHRIELGEILNLYGRKVAAGEWRDYAIDMLKDRAVFSIFRRASEVPIYRVEKHPKLARKQGAFCVIGASGQVLKRGRDLAQVIKVLDRQRKLEVID